MNGNTEKKLQEIKDALVALKASCPISGSLVNYHVIQSQSRTIADVGSSTKLLIKITFSPKIKMGQNRLIEMVGVMSGKSIISGQVVELSEEYVHGKINEDGNPFIEYELEHSVGPASFELTGYAIVAGPADGTFTYETSVQ